MARTKTSRPATRKKSTSRPSRKVKKAPSRPTRMAKKAPSRPRRTSSTLKGPAPLTWTSGGPRLRTAPSRGGTYVLLSHDGVDWIAEWRPTKGRANPVLFRKPVDACVAACERDQVLRFTNEVLVANGSEALTAADLQGDATAWKRRRF